MSAHTPGPWQVSPLDGRTCGPSRLLVQSGTTIAQMQAVAIVTLRVGETDANANLIAAAPDLLAVCEMFVAMYDGLDDMIGPSVTAKVAAARAALAKAKSAA